MTYPDPEVTARHAAWVAAYDAGVIPQALAEESGYSRAAISYVLRRAGRDPGARLRAQQAAARADLLYRQTVAAMADALAADRRCAVCGCWVLRPEGVVTCSPACAQDKPAVTYQRDAAVRERRRRANARSSLRHPERCTEAELAWARRVLSDDPPPPNRRFIRPSSRAYQLLSQEATA